MDPMSFINGLKKFSKTTVGLMAIGVGSTAVIYTTHRLLIKPHFNQKRRLEAESCAEYLFQQETHVSPVARSSPSRSDY